jgi:hypothetical protein
MTKTKSDNAKKGWRTRRIKAKYNDILKLVDNDEELKECLNKHSNLFHELKQSTQDVYEMKNKYTMLLDKVARAGNIMDNLPIESVTDLIEFERGGRPSKGRFGDVIEAGSIKRLGMKIAESKQYLVNDAKMAELDIVEANINAVIKAIDKILDD